MGRLFEFKVLDYYHYSQIDKECRKLCRALNAFPEAVYTVESCCGHGEEPYHIWFKVRNLAILSTIVSLIDEYDAWKIEVNKDDDDDENPLFLLEGPVGAEAYLESEKIAKEIRGAKMKYFMIELAFRKEETVELFNLLKGWIKGLIRPRKMEKWDERR